MKSRWLDIRESAVSLLKVFAMVIVVFRLAQTGIAAADYGGTATQITMDVLGGIAAAVYQGGFIFALAWVVSLIGGQNTSET